MIDFIKKSVTLAFAVVTVIFTFVPESFFGDWPASSIVRKKGSCKTRSQAAGCSMA